MIRFKANNSCCPGVVALACGVMMVVLSSCAIRPSSVLSSRQMVDILTDLHYAEGVLQTAGYNYGHDEDEQQYYGVVLEKHGTTQAIFDSSLVWYTAHPQYFQRVYPKVMKRLEQYKEQEVARLAELDAELKQAIADSLARQGQEVFHLTYDELLQRTLRGLPTDLYTPLPVLPLFSDTLVAKIQEKCDSIAENDKKTCESQEKVVILQPETYKNVSFPEKGATMLRRNPI